jgi:hypothetical protein
MEETMVDESTLGYKPHGAIISTDLDPRTVIMRQRLAALRAEQNRGLGLHPDKLLDDRHETIGVSKSFKGKGGF